MQELFCFSNQIVNLDLTKNTALHTLYCYDNLLLTLNVKNSNNSILSELNAEFNEELFCIQVDNEEIANMGINPYGLWVTENTVNFSQDCD